jgi:hypothetical protein
MTTIKLKNGSGAPTAGDLVQGEPALDLTNKRLYTEDSGGTVIEVGTNPGEDVTFADNRKAIFGAGSDLQIYHDGSASYIADTGTGTLNIKASGSIRLRGNDTDELLARFNENGSNQFYYDSAEKLATTSTGIDVTGTVTADGLTLGTEGDQILIPTSNSSIDGIITTGDTISGNAFEFKNGNAIVLISDTNDSATTGGVDATLIARGSSATKTALFDVNGDISFYEDTGTTAKLFWDASAESLLIGQTSIPTGLGASNTKLILGNFEDAPEFVAYNSDNALALGDKIGAYLFGNDDNNATEDHFAGMWAKSSGTTGAMDIHFAAGKVNYEDDSPHMTLDYNGNVGIGTSSPTADLSVGSIATSSGDIHLRTTKTAASITPSNTDAGGLDIGVGWVSGGQGPLTFTLGSTEAMRIDSSGRLLVGTTSTNYAGVDLAVGNTTDGQNGIAIQTSTTGYGHVLFGDGTGSSAYVGQITYKHGDEYMAFYTAGSEAMRIDSSGNVQIKSGNELQLYRADNGVAVDLYNGGSGVGLVLDDNNGDGFQFKFAGSEKMRIDSSGNLLVGNTDTDPASNNVNGFAVSSGGVISASKGNEAVANFSRRISDGDIAVFKKGGSTVGSIGVGDSDNLYITGGAGSTKGLIFTDDRIIAGANGYNFQDDNTTLGHPSYRFKDLYLSGGAYLGGTGSANKLDDYEEGTWTPAVNAGSISGTSITYTGSYTKIGRQVYIYFNANSASGDINISSYVTFSGLPFSITYLGTGTAITEDIDQFDRQGFAAINGTTLSISNAGSSSGTNSLTVGIVGTTS